jgi:hypothetical protein
MTSLNPIWRDRLVGIGAGIVAVLLGYYVATGSFLLPFIVLGAALTLVVMRVQTLPLQNVVMVGLLAGYIIANRGFAQLTPSASLPLLPGEMALGLLVGLQILSRVTSPNPGRPLSGLDWAVGIWMLVGSVRFGFDFRDYGFMALRDFATIYYATFFFLAYNLAQNEPRVVPQLFATLRISAAVLLPLFLLHREFPGFFLDTLTIRGVPLIHYKDDLVAAYFAVGSVLHYFRYHEHRTRRNFVWAILLAGGVVITNNRAAALGLLVAASWMILGGRWRFFLSLGLAGLVASIALIINAERQFETWRDTPLLGVYERAASVFDPSGQGHYRGENTFNKGDNNLFRTVWWQVVIDETWDEGPVFGLGFGHDLARNFLQEYYADSQDDFTARSPHSIIITLFARTGAVGLVCFLVVIGLVFRQTWQTRRVETNAFPAWCASWVLLTSACFGVVMEGPMGAIPFWILLGLARGTEAKPASVPDSPTPADEVSLKLS